MSNNIKLENPIHPVQLNIAQDMSAAPYEDSNYIHDQVDAADTWTIVHPLQKYPSVTIVDVDGQIVFGEVVYNSLSDITITFSEPFAGKAFLN